MSINNLPGLVLSILHLPPVKLELLFSHFIDEETETRGPPSTAHEGPKVQDLSPSPVQAPQLTQLYLG